MTKATRTGDARYSAYLLLSIILFLLVAACAGWGFFKPSIAFSGAALPAQSVPGGAATGFPGLPVDLNIATVADLVALPGIGERTASVILAMRAERGGFSSVSELGEIRWLGPARLARLEGLVTVVPVQGN